MFYFRYFLFLFFWRYLDFNFFDYGWCRLYNYHIRRGDDWSCMFVETLTRSIFLATITIPTLCLGRRWLIVYVNLMTCSLTSEFAIHTEFTTLLFHFLCFCFCFFLFFYFFFLLFYIFYLDLYIPNS